MYIERQLWQNDWFEYVHEAYRVFISAKLKCHVFTSARIGEISEGSTQSGTGNGLRYKVSIRDEVQGLWLMLSGYGIAGRLERRRAGIAMELEARICEGNAQQGVAEVSLDIDFE